MLNPTWDRIESEFGSRAQLAVLDVTDRESVESARAEAKRLGIESFFDAHKSRTGVIAVIDGATHEPIAVLKGELDFSKYEAAMEGAGKRS